MIRRPALWVLVMATLGFFAFCNDGAIDRDPTSDDLTSESPAQGKKTQLNSQADEAYSPSLSPDGETFVYAGRVSENTDIFRQTVGEETASNLTEDSAEDDYQPAFSPDGKLIAFRSDREDGGIFVMEASGESVRRLTDSGYNPAWSPDGTQIVYARRGTWNSPWGTYGDSRLWTVEVASGEKQQITEVDSLQPSWSPHGHRIAFWSIEDEAGNLAGQRDIWTVPATGGERTRVTDDTYLDWNPVWSPDGRYLYFSSDRSGSMNLWRVLIDEESGKALGSPEAVTTDGSGFGHYSFSKDGKKVAYVEDKRSRDIWKIAFDPTSGTVEGEPVQVTQTSKWESAPDPSPDGSLLAYRITGKQEDIFVMQTDGTGDRKLTDDPHKDFFPRWSPDGKTVAFYSNRGGEYEIWTINRDGSGLKKLTDGNEPEVFAWSPDGSKMVYFDRDGLTYLFDPTKPWEEQTAETLATFSDGPETFYVSEWSPDGRWLAGDLIDTEEQFPGIVVYSLESQKYKRVTELGVSPTWLSDSRRLLLRSGWSEISMVDMQSGKVHEVLSIAPEYISGPALSPDNRWLYFARSTDKSDIWLLTLMEAT